MSNTLLPSAFADLEGFAAKWSLETEAERYATRLASNMVEMQELYDVCVPRMEAALEYLDALDINDLPLDARHLMRLYFSVINASFPVESWKQPRVPDSGAAAIDLIDEPVI